MAPRRLAARCRVGRLQRGAHGVLIAATEGIDSMVACGVELSRCANRRSERLQPPPVLGQEIVEELVVRRAVVAHWDSAELSLQGFAYRLDRLRLRTGKHVRLLRPA